jgi:hypothetical protein
VGETVGRGLGKPREGHPTRRKTIRLGRELRVLTWILLKGLLLLRILLKLVVVELLPIPVIIPSPSRSSSPISSSTAPIRHDHFFRL